MNRVMVLGFAIFLAIVGIAMMGGPQTASAGQGSSGKGIRSKCGGGKSGRTGLFDRKGNRSQKSGRRLLGGLGGLLRCKGSGKSAGGGSGRSGGGADVPEPPPEDPPATEAAQFNPGPLAFRGLRLRR
ncbi:MAG: hypothetical protein IH991_08940 [Planctomycetes bacterium]|nr:hypothetical protein [Planctomycetota bacterium]